MTLPDAISDIANQSMPKHVAIIMDGNGRWAQQRGKFVLRVIKPVSSLCVRWFLLLPVWALMH